MSAPSQIMQGYQWGGKVINISISSSLINSVSASCSRHFKVIRVLQPFFYGKNMKQFSFNVRVTESTSHPFGFDLNSLKISTLV